MDIFETRTAKVMLSGGEGPAFDDPEYIFELKLDGDRCLAYLDGSTMLINRHGRYVLQYLPELTALHRQVANRCILDGELVIGTGSKQDFGRIRERMGVKNKTRQERESRIYPAMFVAFDILYLDGRELLSLPLLERKEILQATVNEGARLAVSRFIRERGKDFFGLAAERGLEGIMGKRIDSVYRMGKRSGDWVKCKNWDRDAFVICGYAPSDKANVASLVLGQFRNGELVFVGYVVLGRGTNVFRAVTALPETKAVLDIPKDRTANHGPITWVKPTLVCQVEFVCRTETGGLRQPVFKRLLADVPAEDAVWPEVLSGESC